MSVNDLGTNGLPFAKALNLSSANTFSVLNGISLVGAKLPDNLFFGTSIATCIMVLKKSKNDNSTLFIDATNYCVKVTNNNKLTDENINDIVKIFTNRENKEYIAKVVSNEKKAENDYNLSVSTYVEKEDTREKIDIVELNKEIDEIVAREQILRDEINKIISEIEV